MQTNKYFGRQTVACLVFLCFFFVGLFCIAYYIYSNEFRMVAWLQFIHYIDALGIFHHSSDEDLDNAVFLSIALVWAPVSVLLTRVVLNKRS